MNSSIFSSKNLKKLSSLPLPLKVWLGTVGLTATLIFFALPWTVHSVRYHLLGSKITRHERVEQLNAETEVLFHGASHTYVGIRPDLMKRKAASLAIEGMEYLTLEQVARKNFHRTPNLKLLVLEYDAVLLSRDAVIQNKNDHRIMWRLGINPFDLRVPSLTTFGQITLQWAGWLALSDIENARKTLREFWRMGLRKSAQKTGMVAALNPEIKRIVGSKPIDCRIKPSTDGSKRVAAHLRQLRRANIDFRLHRDALIRTMQLFQKKDIEVILVQYPHHQTYWDNWPDAFDSRYKATLESLHSSSQLVKNWSFWDLRTLPFLKDSDYCDGNHLNRQGAIKLTQYLNDKIDTFLSIDRSVASAARSN